MRCQRFKWKLSQTLDAGRVVPKALHRHLETCASCRAYAAALGDLHERLNRLEDPATSEAPSSMHTRVMASVRAADSAGHETVWLRPAWSLGLAVLFIIMGWAVWRIQPVEPIQAPVVAQQNAWPPPLTGLALFESQAKTAITQAPGRFSASMAEEVEYVARDLARAEEFIKDCLR
jgi:hypothetical protein